MYDIVQYKSKVYLLWITKRVLLWLSLKQILILHDVYEQVRTDKQQPRVEVSPAVLCLLRVESLDKFDEFKPKTQQEKQTLFVPAAAENTSALVNEACFYLQTLLRGKGAPAESFKHQI